MKEKGIAALERTSSGVRAGGYRRLIVVQIRYVDGDIFRGWGPRAARLFRHCQLAPTVLRRQVHPESALETTA